MKRLTIIAAMAALALLAPLAGRAYAQTSENKAAVEVTTKNFDALTAKGVVLVDFFATWCGPCRAIAPSVEQLAKEYKGRAVVGKCDVDKDGGLARKFGINSIPALLLFKDGILVERQVGACPKDVLQKMLDKHL